MRPSSPTSMVRSAEDVQKVRAAVQSGQLGHILLDATVMRHLCDYADGLQKRVEALEVRAEKAEAVSESRLTFLVRESERVKELEKKIPRCGCGSTSSTRGDPECDACGKDCYYCTCKMPEKDA